MPELKTLPDFGTGRQQLERCEDHNMMQVFGLACETLKALIRDIPGLFRNLPFLRRSQPKLPQMMVKMFVH